MTEREANGLPADDRLPRAVCIPVISVLSVLAWAFVLAASIALYVIGSWLLSVVSP